MSWLEIARRKNAAANAELARRANATSISVPIGDSPATAPGYLHIGHFFSCIPDVQYPWDPSVLRAIRELSPDVVPVTVKSVWRWSNYNELGHLGEPLILVRHALCRAILGAPPSMVQKFACDMPSTPVSGFMIPGRNLYDCRPNFFEVIWYDREVRPHGFDLPGEYLPFDWEMYYSARDAYYDNEEALAQSRREVTDDGEVIAVGAGAPAISARMKKNSDEKAARADARAYIDRDLNAYYSVEPSDVEWKETIMGGGTKEPSKPISVSVPEIPTEGVAS